MMMHKSTVIALSILMAVATASAHPYAEWNNARYRWNDLLTARDEEVGARVRSQASVDLSSCALVTEMMNGKSYRVRVCSADPEDYPNKVCLETRVNPCCPTPEDDCDDLVSSTQVSVAGEDVTVKYYISQDGVCFRLDNTHLRTETCSQPRFEGDSCLPECSAGPPPCFNNTLTGNSSSCNGDTCRCKTGYLSPNCCQCDTTNFYLPDCRSFCRGNCRLFRPANLGGCLTCRAGFTGAPECCQCEPGKIEVNGVCKCIVNTFPNGSCIVGAQAQNCCLCVTGYQKNPDTGKCEPKICDKNQTLYFYIDATRSINYYDFCPLIVVMQMLVAAFNPSSTSGTKINALLFPDIPRSRDPSPVFNSSATCLEAIQGQNGSLLSLLSEFGVCHDNGRAYNSTLFPSLCGEGTSAVKGLQEILRLASTSTRSSAEGAIVMLTDGIIIDDDSKRTEVLNNLKSAGISTLIAAGFNEADEENLKFYTNNILVGDDPVQLGIDIVNKMQERGIVCQDHADNITRILNEARGRDLQLIDLFCRCHRKEFITQSECQRKLYPTCGGSLSFGLPNLQSDRARTEALEYMNRLLIEEEILAAVEKVLEQHHG